MFVQMGMYLSCFVPCDHSLVYDFTSIMYLSCATKPSTNFYQFSVKLTNNLFCCILRLGVLYFIWKQLLHVFCEFSVYFTPIIVIILSQIKDKPLFISCVYNASGRLLKLKVVDASLALFTVFTTVNVNYAVLRFVVFIFCIRAFISPSNFVKFTPD